jgi:hypothetical protein
MYLVFIFPSWLDCYGMRRLSWHGAMQLLRILYRFTTGGKLRPSSARGMSIQEESEKGRGVLADSNEASSRIGAFLKIRHSRESWKPGN